MTSLPFVTLVVRLPYDFPGSWDETIKLWDVPSGEVLHTFVGHNSKV